MAPESNDGGADRGAEGGSVFRLEPMDQAAYTTWREYIEHEYGQDKVRAGNWQPGDADRLSHEAFDELLPQGLATPNHELQVMVNDADERVGMLWTTIQDREPGRVVFIYDIEVDEAHRRRGYARLALAEIERRAAESGCVGVMLHVFGDNAGARELYRSAGFVETNVMMLKRVDG
jgi:ribosomal protein S18 acetylase RimI-like enzyme